MLNKTKKQEGQKRLGHDARSKRQTNPFRGKDQLQTRSYVNNFCQRPSRLASHSEVSMQNLNFYRNYRLFSLKNTTFDFKQENGHW